MTWWRWKPEDAGDDLLRLGGMLRRGVHGDAARLVHPGDCGLRLQVEMLLAANRELAVETRSALDSIAGHVAARQAQWTSVR